MDGVCDQVEKQTQLLLLIVLNVDDDSIVSHGDYEDADDANIKLRIPRFTVLACPNIMARFGHILGHLVRFWLKISPDATLKSPEMQICGVTWWHLVRSEAKCHNFGPEITIR